MNNINVGEKVIIEIIFKATDSLEEREATVVKASNKRFTAVDEKGCKYTFQNGKSYNMSEAVYLFSWRK